MAADEGVSCGKRLAKGFVDNRHDLVPASPKKKAKRVRRESMAKVHTLLHVHDMLTKSGIVPRHPSSSALADYATYTARQTAVQTGI